MAWQALDVTEREIAEATQRWRKRGRFLVDESVDGEAVTFLRDRGWNVKGVHEVDLAGHSDEDVYAFALRDDRIVLTHDDDFLDDRRFPPHRNFCVVILPGGSGTTEPLVRAILNMLAIVGRYRDAYVGSKIVFGVDGEIAIRSRDSSTGAVRTNRYRLRKNAMPEIWVEV